jgi:RNA polymerase sigma-70 factor (ECF subfamily)
MNPDTTAEELLARVLRRDAEALGDLYERFAPRVLGTLARILPARSLAEEVLQEVFLRLWNEARNLVYDHRSVAAWLMVMARQTALDRVRAARKCPGRPVAGAESHGDFPAGKTAAGRSRLAQPSKSVAGKSATAAFVTAMPPAWVPRPEEIARVEERLGLLQKVASQLPKAQRQALDLAVFGGYTEAEMAEEFGEPLGKVRTALRAAITFLGHRFRAVLGTWTANL